MAHKRIKVMSKSLVESLGKEFNDIEKYRTYLVGGRIERVEFTDSDEGLRLTTENGNYIEFEFNGCEGSIKVGAYYE